MEPKNIAIRVGSIAVAAGAAYKFLPGNMRERAIGALAAGLFTHIVTNAVMGSMMAPSAPSTPAAP